MTKRKRDAKSEIPDYPFENIVIEGGGGRIVCIGGTLKVLDRLGILDKMKRYAGTSAGAIVATGLCVGYGGSEMAEMLMTTDFNKFLDDSFGITKDLFRLYNSFGFYKGDAFYEFAKDTIAKKVKDPNITFKELYELTKKELVIVATNLTKDAVMYLSRHTEPDMPVALAVRASMSIPFVFRPVIYKGQYLVDGGVSFNYPLHIFDGEYPNNIGSLFKSINNKTIGLKFMSDKETRNIRIYSQPSDIKNIFSFSTSILLHLMNRIERTAVNTGYFERTVTIPTGKIGMMDFNLSDRDKRKAQRKAQEVATAELNYYNANNRFPTSPASSAL